MYSDSPLRAVAIAYINTHRRTRMAFREHPRPHPLRMKPQLHIGEETERSSSSSSSSSGLTAGVGSHSGAGVDGEKSRALHPPPTTHHPPPLLLSSSPPLRAARSPPAQLLGGAPRGFFSFLFFSFSPACGQDASRVEREISMDGDGGIADGRAGRRGGCHVRVTARRRMRCSPHSALSALSAAPHPPSMSRSAVYVDTWVRLVGAGRSRSCTQDSAVHALLPRKRYICTSMYM